jgi:hypothetical protein
MAVLLVIGVYPLQVELLFFLKILILRSRLQKWMVP